MPGPGEVVVRIAAAAVNFPDVLFVANQYQVSVPVPFTPGSEFAGEVVTVGDGVTDLAVGQRVFGSVMVGAFAEEVLVSAASLTPAPDGVELQAAAGFGVAYGTAYHSLRSVGRVQPRRVGRRARRGRRGGARRRGRRRPRWAPGWSPSRRPRRSGRCASTTAPRPPSTRRSTCATGCEEATGGARRGRDHRPGRRTAGRAGPPGRSVGRAVRHGGLRVGRDPPHPAQPRAAQGRHHRRLRDAHVRAQRPRGGGAATDRPSSWRCSPPARLHPHIGARFPLDDTAAALRYVADRKAIGKVIIEP